MQIVPIILFTDALLFGLLLLLITWYMCVKKSKIWQLRFTQMCKKPSATAAIIVLLFFCCIGILDSFHYTLKDQSEVKSIFDTLVFPLGTLSEKTYSAPFSTHLYVKLGNENVHRLKHAGVHLQNPAQDKIADLFKLLKKTLSLSSLLWIALSLVIVVIIGHKKTMTLKHIATEVVLGRFSYPMKTVFFVLFVLLFCTVGAYCFIPHYHILGTDKVGQDVFYASLKSIRTGMLIGTLTTFVMLPFALFFGTMAGFFRGWIDDLIQYLYTVLSSIPGVLLIAAAVLTLQVGIELRSEYFETMLARADARLAMLCFILGLTSWTSLCRLLRAETLKIRTQEYVLAARALGVSSLKIITKHVIPNVTHIVLIAVVLDFSTLVLAEVVLSYVGVGVSPSTYSWGNMINAARLEMAREPIVWWTLTGAFGFMFVFVLAANIFSDALRDALDPRV